MITECPHCFTRVAVAPDGVCPACKMNCNDTAYTDQTKTSLTLPHQASLSSHCCDCGTKTQRKVKVVGKVSQRSEQANPALGVMLLLGLVVSFLFLPLALLLGLRKRSGDVVVVQMPQCEKCGESGRPVPIRINSERLTMTFVVDKGFKKRNNKTDHNDAVAT